MSGRHPGQPGPTRAVGGRRACSQHLVSMDFYATWLTGRHCELGIAAVGGSKGRSELPSPAARHVDYLTPGSTAQLAAIIHGHWAIEDRLPGAATWAPAWAAPGFRTASSPRIMAALRNLAVTNPRWRTSPTSRCCHADGPTAPSGQSRAAKRLCRGPWWDLRLLTAVTTLRTVNS